MHATLSIVALGLAGAVAVVVAGFLVPFPGFPPPASRAPGVAHLPIPVDVPAPVERYLRAVSLDGITLPHATSFAYRGTGSARPFGVWLPLRHRAIVVPGSLLLREMAFPWYGVTLLHVTDSFERGRGATVLRGVLNAETRGPRTDQGAFLALAAESILVPSSEALGGRWQALGSDAARLVVPFRGGEESLTVSFDPGSGLPRTIRAERYKGEDGPKVGWRIELGGWREGEELRFPTRFEVVWEDTGQAWSRWLVAELTLNVGLPTHQPAPRAVADVAAVEPAVMARAADPAV